jgi:glycine cleavage system pyridoxal-binding protein P
VDGELGPGDQAGMLAEIGAASVEELFGQIPAAHRRRRR